MGVGEVVHPVWVWLEGDSQITTVHTHTHTHVTYTRVACTNHNCTAQNVYKLYTWPINRQRSIPTYVHVLQALTHNVLLAEPQTVL